MPLRGPPDSEKPGGSSSSRPKAIPRPGSVAVNTRMVQSALPQAAPKVSASSKQVSKPDGAEDQEQTSQVVKPKPKSTKRHHGNKKAQRVRRGILKAEKAKAEAAAARTSGLQSTSDGPRPSADLKSATSVGGDSLSHMPQARSSTDGHGSAARPIVPQVDTEGPGSSARPAIPQLDDESSGRSD